MRALTGRRTGMVGGGGGGERDGGIGALIKLLIEPARLFACVHPCPTLTIRIRNGSG